MTSTNFNYRDYVSYSDSNPTTVGYDGQHHFVTSDGTSNGDVLSFWTFDAPQNKWVELPVGSTDCPISAARSSILTLAASNALNPNCQYVINDFDSGTVGPASIEITAVDASTLSQSGYIKTQYDNTAWACVYDIDTDEISQLTDNNGNSVRGWAAISVFPWGNSNVFSNTLENGILNYSSGVVMDCLISGGTVLNATSNVTACKLHSATVTTGSVNFNSCNIKSSTVDFSGSTGVFQFSEVSENSDLSLLTNIPSVSINYLHADNTSSVSANNAASFSVTSITLSNRGAISVASGSEITINYSTIDSNSLVDLSNGNLNCSFLTIVNNSQLLHNSGGQNTLSRVNINSQSYIRIDSGNGNRILYSSCYSGGFIRISGNANSNTFLYNSISSNGRVQLNSSSNGRFYYCSVSSSGRIDTNSTLSQNHRVYYGNANSNGRIQMRAASGVLNAYGVSAYSTGRFRVRGRGTVYHSSVGSFYYLNLTLNNANRFGLHGFGRQTYSVTNPPNGAGTRNF